MKNKARSYNMRPDYRYWNNYNNPLSNQERWAMFIGLTASFLMLYAAAAHAAFKIVYRP